jgi:hypothetical protein
MALRKTAAAADEVSVNFIKAMRNFSDIHEKHYPAASVSLIFHSMGNHIIRNISQSELISYLPQHLFSNIILNAAAVRQHNHAKWLEKLNIQKRIYITINDEDFTLHGAMILRLSKQLGLGYKDGMATNAM